MFSRLDRYVFREWAKVFCLTVGVILALLLIGEMQNHLDDLLAFGASGREIVAYYLVFAPSLIPAMVPMSLLISLLFALGQLTKNQEIVAMRAAGLSLWRIARTLWLAGASLTAAQLWLNAEVVPWSVESSRETWNNFAYRDALAQEREVDEIGVIQNLTFHHPENGRLWFVNRFNEYQYRAFGVSISQFDATNRESSRLLANEGYFSESAGHWVLLEGRELSFDPDTGDVVRSLPFERRELTHLTEDPDLMQFLKKRPKDLSLWELRRVIGALEGSADPRLMAYEIQYYGILVNPLSCLIVVGIAIPFAVRGGRTNPMVGVSKAVGLFLLYYVISHLTAHLGAQVLDAAMIALLPNFLMILFAAFLFWRATKPA